MKRNLAEFSRAWLLALRRHLSSGRPDDPKAARALGHRAVALGLETLDLARIHDESLEVLLPASVVTRARHDVSRRAGSFFTEALTPVEETHRGAREANIQLQQMVATVTRRTEELATANAELRLLSHRLLSVQEEERKRISRELHDVIGQTLAVINLRLAALNSQTAARGKDLCRKITQTQRLVEKSVAIVHRFARDLRPAVLDDLGLIPALVSYIKSFSAGTALRVNFHAFAGVDQEALSNIVRHAHASRAEVRILNRKGALHMLITDNGAGFPESGRGRSRVGRRLGLLGMKERVEMVGGTFRIESAPEAGTAILVVIPARHAVPTAKQKEKL